MVKEKGSQTAVRTYCPLSKSRCAIICHVEDGKLTEVRKDPDHPNCANLCPKGLAAPELVYHPERLKYPLRRTNPKTVEDPGWKRISWEEALTEIADRLKNVVEDNTRKLLFQSAACRAGFTH